VPGRISEFLRTVGPEDALTESRLREQIAAVTPEREELEAQLDAGAKAARLAGAMDRLTRLSSAQFCAASRAP
jgi:hypothetical protein